MLFSPRWIWLGCLGWIGGGCVPGGDPRNLGVCGEDSGLIGLGEIDEACCGVEAEVVLGEMGAEGGDWVDLSAGDDVDLIFGPQNGWHLFGNFRACGFRDRVKAHLTITRESGQILSESAVWVETLPLPNQDCCHYFTGLYGYLDTSVLEQGETVPDLSCETVVFNLTLDDDGGKIASTTMELVVHEPGLEACQVN